MKSSRASTASQVASGLIRPAMKTHWSGGSGNHNVKSSWARRRRVTVEVVLRPQRDRGIRQACRLSRWFEGESGAARPRERCGMCCCSCGWRGRRPWPPLGQSVAAGAMNDRWCEPMTLSSGWWQYHENRGVRTNEPPRSTADDSPYLGQSSAVCAASVTHKHLLAAYLTLGRRPRRFGRVRHRVCGVHAPPEPNAGRRAA